MRTRTIVFFCSIVLSCAAVSIAASGDLRLVEAAKNRDAPAVRALLKQRGDVNARLGDGSTALAWAAHWDDLETADLLIQAGADVNIANSFGDTALWEACNNASAAMVVKLAGAGASPNAPLLRTGETALMRCARTGNVEAVRALLEHGADLTVKENQKGQTALMWAIEERHSEVARLLIERGADVKAKTKSGFTPMLVAARQGDLHTGRLLVERGVDVNETGPGGLSVLLLAIDSGRDDFALFLLEKGASPNATDPDGLTPLHYSMRYGISVLRGATDNSNNANQDYLFRPNMTKVVMALLERGANPNARTTKTLRRLGVNDRPMLSLAGATPFLLAAASADIEIVRALLSRGADPNLTTRDNTTPLMVAAGVGRWRGDERPKEEAKLALEVVKLLVGLGADVNASSNDLATNIPGGGSTALHGAALSGADDMVQFLVEKGADLDAKDFFGMTPLSIAEGNPNGLLADFSGSQRHESTARLLRKLAGLTPADAEGAPLATATGK